MTLTNADVFAAAGIARYASAQDRHLAGLAAMREARIAGVVRHADTFTPQLSELMDRADRLMDRVARAADRVQTLDALGHDTTDATTELINLRRLQANLDAKIDRELRTWREAIALDIAQIED